VDVSVKDLEVVNTVVANNDEILDVVHLGVNASHLAVACNSSALRLYEVLVFFNSIFSSVADPYIFVRGSVPLINESESGSGSCYFRQ
jgi:hypothetical protein